MTAKFRRIHILGWMLIVFISTPNLQASPNPKAFEKELKENLGMNYSLLKKETNSVRKHKFGLKLPDEQVLSLYSYTLGSYRDINSNLRKGNVTELKKTPIAIETLKSALEGLPNFRGTAYRGTKLPKELLVQYSVGKIISDPAFLSASLVGSYGGPHQMRIKSKTGKIISPFSSRPNEVEVLFQPNTKFKVFNISKNANGSVQFDMEEQ